METTGVLDIIPLTDFPDIRKNCVIRSEHHGNLMLIPRRNRLIRLYVQLLSPDSEESRTSVKSSCSERTILEAAQRILQPFKLHYKYCDWWSVDQVGQRLAETYSLDDRIFLAGDAAREFVQASFDEECVGKRVRG